jgi:hypothetical protein
MVLHQCGDKKDLWDAVARARERDGAFLPHKVSPKKCTVRS